jgi:ATP-dependent helicase/nuclease subunit B
MHRYSELRRRAVDFVTQFSPAGPVLVLAPVRAAAEEVALEGCGAALVNVKRLAFREFVLELSGAEMNRRGLIPVGRFVREALAARVTADALRLGQLEYLRPVASFPGFPRALTATFEELRLNAVGPEQLRECGQSGRDLARLLQAYTNELAARGLADHATRVDLARNGFSAGYNSLRQMAVVALDIVPRSRMERELFVSVMKAARVSLELHLTAGEPEAASALDSLQQYLFSELPVPPREDDGSVAIFSTSGEALECVEIARAIHAAAAQGVPFDEIAILLRSPDRHQPLILEALRRAGIPAHCTLAVRRPDAAGRSLLALLYCAAEGLSASRFAEYLSLGQMPEGEEPVTPALWERHLVDAAVIGGEERWRKRLLGWREELQQRYEAQEDDTERERLARRIHSVENLTLVALPTIARLAQLPERGTWGEWSRALISLAEFALRDPAHAIELIEQLDPMSDIGPVALPEVLLVLGPRLNTLGGASEESRFGRVWIGSIEEARGMAFRRVFVPGVNEGLFPRPPAEDPLLLESQRGVLGIELRAEDTELLRVAAATASERLTLSFSRLDLLTGRERVPSFYAFEAHRAAGGREMAVREFEAQARSATETRIGWPAPANAAEAIDDAEFDLATLAPRAKGSGQYLKKLPGRAVDSLRARWTRWHKPWKAADGLLIEEIGSTAMAPYLLSAHAWSPSVLQQFARCPYRFALRGIHGLRPAEQPSAIQRMDPATRGEIYHAVQFELLRDRPTADAALERLDDVLHEVAKRYEEKLAPAIPQIWRAEVQAIRADLRGWLQYRAANDAEWTPLHSELSFGMPYDARHDPHSRRDPVVLEDGFRLQGSIDLVERHSSGVLRVVDHKTGKMPEPRPEMVGGGEVLQPALYALAAEKMLGEAVAFGRLHYSTIAQNYRTVDVPLNDWSRHRAALVLRVIDDAIRDGFLPAAPRKDGCKRCDYLPVCGPYEEERAAGKLQPELKSLKDLRLWK